MTYYAYPLGAELVAFGVWCMFLVLCWGTFKILVWGWPKVAAWWQSRGTVAEVPEDHGEAFRGDAAIAEAVEQIMAEPEGQEYRESLDFDAWEAECRCRPRIARYVARLEERAR